mgnify:FL=1
MNIHQYQLISKRGFTLVEIVVALTIILVLTGIFLVSYYSGNSERNLTDASFLISQEIRKAQDLALVQSSMPAECREYGEYGEWPGSFGVYFSTSTSTNRAYVDLFGDKDSEGDYDISGAACGCTGANECVERQFLPSNVKINKIKVGSSGSECTSAWINFSLSDIAVQIKNSCSITDNSKIEIEILPQSGGEEKKTIIINNKGMVEIK